MEREAFQLVAIILIKYALGKARAPRHSFLKGKKKYIYLNFEPIFLMFALVNVYFTVFICFYFILSDWKESNEGNCAYIKATKMSASDCSRFMHFICEK